jgi:hypothetical protein
MQCQKQASRDARDEGCGSSRHKAPHRMRIHNSLDRTELPENTRRGCPEHDLRPHHDELLSSVDSSREADECDATGIVQAPRLDLPLE